jgi:rRNA small subunit pseudouridine methyltransferase Nep1
MPLTIILAECGLELIPKDIQNQPSVKKNLKEEKYSSQLLDNALHHSSMKNLKNYEKRGRPDITHLCLLNALGSPLNITGNLSLYIHTVQNKIFKFNPKIRIARNYNRFKGLTAKLLLEGRIITEEIDLITQFKGNLKKLIETVEKPNVVLCSKKGKLFHNYQEIFPQDFSKNYIVIIGGFQKGSYTSEILELSNNLISISENSLDAWVVVNKVITFYEIRHNIS